MIPHQMLDNFLKTIKNIAVIIYITAIKGEQNDKSSSNDKGGNV